MRSFAPTTLARSQPARRAQRAALTRFRDRVAAVDAEDRRAVAGRRGRLLVGAVLRLAPLAFNRRRARDLEAGIEWRLAQPDGTAILRTFDIREGRCRVRRRPLAHPDLVIELTAGDFLRLVAGLDDGVALFGRGRLRLSGDLGLAMKLPRLFRPGGGRSESS